MPRRKRNRRTLRGSWADDPESITLSIDNDYDYYKQKQAIQVNLTRHVCRGQFDQAAAERGFSHVTNRWARDMQRKERGLKVPTKARREADKLYVKEYLRDLADCRADPRSDFCPLPQEAAKLLQKPKCRPGDDLRGAGPFRRRRRRR